MIPWYFDTKILGRFSRWPPGGSDPFEDTQNEFVSSQHLVWVVTSYIYDYYFWHFNFSATRGHLGLRYHHGWIPLNLLNVSMGHSIGLLCDGSCLPMIIAIIEETGREAKCNNSKHHFATCNNCKPTFCNLQQLFCENVQQLQQIRRFLQQLRLTIATIRPLG